MKFDFDQSNSATLKKTTEEGLDLVLGHEMKGATATLTYKVIVILLSFFQFQRNKGYMMFRNVKTITFILRSSWRQTMLNTAK